MTDLPTVTHTGTLNLPGLEMRVHVLSGGQRIIPVEDFEAFIAWMENGGDLSEDDALDFARLLKGVER